MVAKTPPSLELSVIICAYTEERWDDLLAAIESVTKQRWPPLETIVVIDHNPALLDRLSSYLARTSDVRDIRVRLIENREPRGLSGARNSGVAAASGGIVAFLDDDASAEPDWLERLRRPYADAGVLGAGGVIEPVWLGGRPRWFPDEFKWVVGCSYRGMPEQAAPVRNLLGANMSLRRSVFDEIGGFRHGIGRVGKRPVGCEETELYVRAQQRWPAARMVYEPAACVHHRVPAERATWRYFIARCYAEGISKALISEYVGTHAGLASERVHASVTLPRGVARALLDAVRGDWSGPLRAGAIIAGLVATTAGFASGMASRRRASALRGESAWPPSGPSPFLWQPTRPEHGAQETARPERGVSAVPHTPAES